MTDSSKSMAKLILISRGWFAPTIQKAPLKSNKNHHTEEIQVLTIDDNFDIAPNIDTIHQEADNEGNGHIFITQLYRCPDGCKKCHTNDYCDDCLNGLKYNPERNMCVTSCPENSNLKGKTCYFNGTYNMDINTISEKKSIKACTPTYPCIKCTIFAWVLESCTECAAGYILIDPTVGTDHCEAIPEGCSAAKEVLDGVSCTAFYSGYFLYDPAIGRDRCDKCSTPCKECSGSATSCTSCYDGYYKSGTTCTTCQSPCKTCTAASTCKSCIDGYYLSGTSCIKYNSACTKCTAAGTTQCQSCASGYFFIWHEFLHKMQHCL